MSSNQEEIRYSVSADDHIVSLAGNWLPFAKENDAIEFSQSRVVGESIWNFIAGPEIRHLYKLIFTEVRQRRPEIAVPFRCDSPTKRRFMELRIVRLHDAGLNLMSCLLKEEERPYQVLLDSKVDSSWLVTICSWCKRIRLDSGQWVEVEAAVEELGVFDAECTPLLSHGICGHCKDAALKEIAVSKT